MADTPTMRSRFENGIARERHLPLERTGERYDYDVTRLAWLYFEAAWQAAFLSSSKGEVEATHRHVKTGGDYVLLGIGRMQSGSWGIAGDPSCELVDMREVAIYRSLKDGSLWARPREEFEDGRFAALPSSEVSS